MKLIRKPLVVVGIDPGTTLGYAILDLKGNVLRLGSERGGSLKRLLEESTYHGIPIISSTDKMKCPELVHQFCAKTGSRLVAPPADLTLREKRALADDGITNNSHELDALSAARFALKKYSAMFAKVDKALLGRDDERFSEEVKRLLIKKDGLGISEALDIIKEREYMRSANKSKDIGAEDDEFSPSKEDYLKLRVRLRKLEDDYRRLKQSQSSLLEEIERDEADNRNEGEVGKTDFGKRKLNRLLRLRARRIRELERRLSKEAEINAMLKKFISELGPMQLAKKLDNLTYDEFLRKDRLLKIHEGDVLLVEDAESHSKKTLDALKGRVGIILYRGRLTSDIKKSRDFIFLDASKLRISEVDEFALVGRQELERLRRESSGVIDMFERYKESRKRGY